MVAAEFCTVTLVQAPCRLNPVLLLRKDCPDYLAQKSSLALKKTVLPALPFPPCSQQVTINMYGGECGVHVQ